MTDQQKKEVKAWELKQRFDMPQGGRMTLAFILEEERKRAKNNPTDIALPEFLTTVHPALYYLFIIDWSSVCAKRIPVKYRGDGAAFGRDVLDEWLSYCDKKSYYKDGMLSNYSTIDQVKEVIAKLTAPDGITYRDPDRKVSYDYSQMEERMYEIRQRVVDAEHEADLKAEAERKLQEEAQRKQAEAERKQRKADEKLAAAAAEEQRKRQEQSARLDQLVIEAQSLIDQAPLPKSVLKLYTRPHDANEPYTAEIAWNNIGKVAKDRRDPDVFTGSSFVEVVSKAKSYIAHLLDEIMDEQKREKQRAVIREQIESQNNAFSEAMAHNRKMLEQIEQQMAAMSEQHNQQIEHLKAELAAI